MEAMLLHLRLSRTCTSWLTLEPELASPNDGPRLRSNGERSGDERDESAEREGVPVERELERRVSKRGWAKPPQQITPPGRETEAGEPPGERATLPPDPLPLLFHILAKAGRGCHSRIVAGELARPADGCRVAYAHDRSSGCTMD